MNWPGSSLHKSHIFFAGLVFCKTCYARLHGPQVKLSVFCISWISLQGFGYSNTLVSDSSLEEGISRYLMENIFQRSTCYAFFQHWQMIWRSLFRYCSQMFCCPGPILLDPGHNPYIWYSIQLNKNINTNINVNG